MPLEIREANFDSRGDIEAFIQAVEDCMSRVWERHGEFGFLGRKWAVGFWIGHFMRQDQVKEGKYVNTRFYVISENGMVKAVGLQFPAYSIPVSPIIEVMPLTAYNDQAPEMYMALARKLKTEGYPKIYCHIIKGSLLELRIPLQQRIGDYPRPPEKGVYTLWEMEV